MSQSESSPESSSNFNFPSRNINDQGASSKSFDSVRPDHVSVTEQCLPSMGNSPEALLMTSDEINNQTDIDTLQQQLASAHQLLEYQQSLIHCLTEKMAHREVALAQSAQGYADLQKKYETQSLELSAVQSVCCDLRSLLQRQQSRAAQTPVPLLSPEPAHTYTLKRLPVHTSSHDLISFGYESASDPSGSAPSTKSPPVKVWSAEESPVQLDTPLPFYRKLTTMMLPPSDIDFAQVSSVPTMPPSQADSLPTPGRVELPRFSSLDRG